MKKYICFLTICIYMIGVNSCKKYDDDAGIIENLVRIKQISEYNNIGEEINREVFGYENERIVSKKCSFLNVNSELEECRKTIVTYNGNNAIASKFFKKNDEWILDKKSKYFIYNNQVQEELKSRYGFPECLDCWKYKYTYSGSYLQEWKSYLKIESNHWEEYRKGQYLYENDKLVEYKLYELEDQTVWKLIFKKNYTCMNGRITGWLGGTCNKGNEWCPTQKMDYSYEKDNVSTLTYSVCDRSIAEVSWIYFGSVNYFYGENGCLVRETSSDGQSIIYTYEKGNGNAPLFFSETNDFPQIEPAFKSAIKAMRNEFPPISILDLE